MAIRSGADYIKGLRDGRQVWHAGRRIEDVTTHSGFTGTILRRVAVVAAQALA